MRYFQLVAIVILLLTSLPTHASYDKALSQFYKGQYNTSLKTLKSISSREYPEKFVLSALCHLGNSNPDKGIASLNKYMPQSGEAPYISYIYGLLYLEKGDVERVMDSDYFIQQSIIKPFLIQSLRLQIMSYYRKQRDWENATKIRKRSLKNIRNPYTEAQVLKEEVLIEIGLHNRGAALKKYAKFLALHPESDPDKRLWKRLQKTWEFKASFYTNFETIEDHLTYSQNALRTGQYDEVLKHHEFILKTYPDHPILYRFYFDRALALYHLRQYNLAAREFNRFVEPIMSISDPDYLVMKYYSGMALMYLDEPKYALEQFSVVLNAPHSPYYEKTLFHAIKIAENTDLHLYTPLIKTFTEKYRNTAYFNEYHWEKNWKDLNDHSPPETELILSTLVEYPIKQKLVRWYKRTFPTLTQFEANTRGIESFPISYKAHQAILGLTEIQPHTLFLNKKLSQKLNRLERMGLRPLLIDELTFDANRENRPKLDTIYHLARLYVESGNYEEGLSIIQSGFEDLNISLTEVPQPFLRLMYPKLYWRDIQTFAKKYKVDPYLVLALVREGSFFNTKKHSFDEKRGLMQLTPDNGRKIAFRIGQYWPGPQILYNPRSNIKLGTFYVSWLEDQFGDHLHYIIAAKNAGPDTARLWANSKRSHLFTQFQTAIPDRQTRQYMQRVLDTYLIYKLVDDPTLK